MSHELESRIHRLTFSRRQILKGGLMAGAGLAAFRFLGSAPKADSSPKLTKYVDELPIPGVVQPTSIVGGVPQYTLEMKQFLGRVHRDLPPTTLWGYNGTWPGPTFEARTGKPIDVLWVNDLPSTHILEKAYDVSLHGADLGEPHVRTVVHLHGAKVMPDSDGYPEAWFTKNWAKTGPFFTTKTYHYPNDQQATTMWYHDHSLGITRLNVMTGLAGFYLLRDSAEDRLNLPQGPYEVPLLIQDRIFYPDGSLDYPIVLNGSHNVWIPEFFGDIPCVNGKAFPFLRVEPRKYRFRFLNGCNSRILHMTLVDAKNPNRPVPAFNQIGTDGGLLPAPVALTDLLMAPAERFDVVIDFSPYAGRTFTLLNDAPAPFPGGGEVGLPEIMQFQVSKPLAAPDSSLLPASLAPISLIPESQATAQRYIMLSEADRASDGFPIIGELGGSPIAATPGNPTGGARWDDPVVESPGVGATEIWNLVNVSTDAHPIHVHLVQFQVLDRRTFDLQQFMQTGKVVFTGDPIPPAPNERPAFKDTVKAFSGVDKKGNVTGLVTRLIAKYDLPTGTKVKVGDRFRYVYHCHILEHEDNEMMRPFDVVG
ncbi:MAG TPA: multicopper oxidase [Candidatus Methylomirabilis sp.]|nr:multicopper oxidase [Candidatus Methylomirabilis sp.]